MDLVLRALAALLLIAGVPAFLLLAITLGALAAVGPPQGNSDAVVTKFFMVYAGVALAGLVSAAGGVLWAVTRLAYPRRAARTPNQPLQQTAGA